MTLDATHVTHDLYGQISRSGNVGRPAANHEAAAARTAISGISDGG